MSAANVLYTMEQAIANIDLLYQMPALADWELETRIKANVDHAKREFNKWLLELEKKKKVPA